MRHPVGNILFAGLLFLASGSLLSASSESSVQVAVDAVLRRHVQAGVTEAADVIAQFGQPAIRQARRGPGESVVLGYNHESIVPQRFPLLPLISISSRRPADTYFEVADGVVTRYWTTM